MFLPAAKITGMVTTTVSNLTVAVMYFNALPVPSSDVLVMKAVIGNDCARMIQEVC